MVNLFYEDTEILDLRPEFFVSWYGKLCANYGFELGEISLIFCSDNYLLEINREHLNHDYYTDIITFNYNEKEVVSGDLFISVDRVKENALDNKVLFLDELYRVCAHGVLHLFGFNDKSDKDIKQMRKKEEEALRIVSRGTI